MESCCGVGGCVGGEFFGEWVGGLEGGEGEEGREYGGAEGGKGWWSELCLDW